jgi:Holliday junction resolvase RusA-like endonuclease
MRESASNALRRWRAAVVETWTEGVWWHADPDRITLPLSCPVALRMVFTVRRPQLVPNDRLGHPATRPDVSKYVRAVEDAMKDAGIIADDGRVVGYDRLWKTYPCQDLEALGRPGVVVSIRRLPQASLRNGPGPEGPQPPDPGPPRSPQPVLLPHEPSTLHRARPADGRS